MSSAISSFRLCTLRILISLLILYAVSSVALGQNSQVVVYTQPSVRKTSTQFTVSAAPVTGGIVGSAQSSPTFQFAPTDPIRYSFSQFSFGGTVQITVTDLTENAINTWSISPKAFDLKDSAKVTGNTLTLTLAQSRYLIIKINNLPELILAADALEVNPPASSGTGIENITMPPYNVTSTMAPADTTAAIQRAINAAGAESGTAYVPAGVYQIDRLTLPSNANLYLAGGAVLRDSGARCGALYPAAGKMPQGCYASTSSTIPTDADFSKSSIKNPSDQTPMSGKWLISTIAGSKNASITGRGMIDGNGYAMRNSEYYLNTLIMPNDTQHFTVDGIVAWNAGFWAFTPARSSYITIRNYKGLDDLGPAPGIYCEGNTCMQEDDAIDINESSNVLVQHALVVSRDDNYSTKTWSGTAGGLTATWGGQSGPVDDVLFTDIVAWSLDDAFKIGNGDYEAHNGITFDHGYVYSAGCAAEIFPDYGAATVSNIVFQNLDIETTTNGTTTVNSAPWAKLTSSGTTLEPISQVGFYNINVRNPVTTQYVNVTAKDPEPSNFIWANIVNSGTRVRANTDLFGPKNTPALGASVIVPYIVAAPMAASASDTQSGTNPALAQDPLTIWDHLALNGGQNGAYIGWTGLDLGAGASSASLRVATADTGGVIGISIGSQTATPIGSDMFNASTGGWESWRTDKVSLSGSTTGTQSLFLDFSAPSGHTAANVDWIQINLAHTVQAESFTSSQYATTGACSDPDDLNCEKVILTNNGYVGFANVTFPAGLSTVYLRMAAQYSGTVSICLDDPNSTPIGTMPVALTINPVAVAGTAGIWQTVPIPVTGLTGQHTLYLVASGRSDSLPVININWLAY